MKTLISILGTFCLITAFLCFAAVFSGWPLFVIVCGGSKWWALGYIPEFILLFSVMAEV